MERTERTRALPFLVASLDDKNWFIRWRGAQFVQRLGQEGVEAVPALIRCFQDKNEILRDTARDALVKMGPKAVPSLIDLLRSAEAPDLNTSYVLAGIGASSVPLLLETLDVGTRATKWSALFALFLMEPPPNSGKGWTERALVGPRLLSFLEDSDYSIRQRATFVLARMQYATDIVTNAALKDLRDPNYLVRRDAAYALGWMGPPAVKAVPSLTAALHDSSDEVRAAAAGALGFIGPGALEALGDLSGALQDGVEHVREVSAEALKRIQGTKDEAQR